MSGISIALFSYNGDNYIERQLQSLSQQTLQPCELVVFDDRSTDSNFEIIRSISSSSPFPVTVIVNEERVGYRRNFMKAAHLCQGDLIAFSDQDDIWEPEKLATVSGVFEDSQVVLCVRAKTC